MGVQQTGAGQQTAGEAGNSTSTGTGEGQNTSTGASISSGTGTVTATGGESRNAGGESASTEARFTQADVDRVVRQRLAEERQRREREDAEKRAKEQGEYQKLAEQYKTELERERLGRLRLEVASRHRLPPELAARLQGTTEQELDADAKALVKLVGTTGQVRGGGADGGAGSTTAPKTSMNDFIRKAATGR